ncbi:MAG: 4-hydroxythreonine-4-phosphate dehydrogenase PdxA [Hyphomicrobiaceae bacterium]
MNTDLARQSRAAPLAVTMGDPAGIGLELTAMAWHRRHSDHIPPFAFYGCAAALGARAHEVGMALPLRVVTEPRDAMPTFDAALPVIDIPLIARPVPGVASPSNAGAVIASIERAVADTVRGGAGAVVTNPIAKSVLYQAGFTHPGHTEFLAELAGRLVPGGPYLPVMMIASEALRVVPLTIHIPLAAVPGAIRTDSIVQCARIMAIALKRDFAIAHPRIAIAGLNPHAGEDGSMGREDIEIIAPAIAQLKAEGIDVSGPHPADTLFHAERRATYDAVLAMYHDQALIPAKTLAFETGVNVTLGLPFVRTSPDHGTAFDIAGRGLASPSSLIAAMRLARSMSDMRAAANGAIATDAL